MASSSLRNEANIYHETASHSESDSEADDQDLHVPTELDRMVLEDEEQEEKLLLPESNNCHPGDLADRGLRDTGRQKRRKELRQQRRSRKRSGKGVRDEEGKLMYEMEEGGSRDDASSQSSSSSLDVDSSNQRQTTSKRRRRARNVTIAVTIAGVFVLLAFGSYKSSRKMHRRPSLPCISNGTSMFAPTTILISLDGFRADFLNRNLTPALNSFVAQGVSPKYMLPSFPSVTFPNHYTIVTGLHPESHGVVGNSFWDADLGEEFFYTDPARSMQPKWWSGGEPLWVTAEKQNVKTAIHMWPGSEAHIQLEPTYLDKFNGSEHLSRKVERIFQFLDMPGLEDVGIENAQTRPQLIAAYVPNVDSDGHKYGPNSTEILRTIFSADDMLHQLLVGLDQRNLSDIVNVVVVSDHGMATTSTDRLVQLDDLIDLDLIEHIDGWPLYGLRPKNPTDLRQLYQTLKAESLTNTHFDVYLRDEDMPERYHFSKNERIAPLWVIPKTGWAIVHKEDFDITDAKAEGIVYSPKGLHGYDHEHPLMRAIFVARGPAFPHEPNSRLEPFQNLEVYNIVCDSLGIEPEANNGTLRLPLKPVGFHSDQPMSLDETPIDLPSDAEASTTGIADPDDLQSQTTPDTNPTNSTSNKGSEDTSQGDSFYEKWKQMIANVKAAMANLMAKLHQGSSSAATPTSTQVAP